MYQTDLFVSLSVASAKDENWERRENCDAEYKELSRLKETRNKQSCLFWINNFCLRNYEYRNLRSLSSLGIGGEGLILLQTGLKLYQALQGFEACDTFRLATAEVTWFRWFLKSSLWLSRGFKAVLWSELNFIISSSFKHSYGVCAQFANKLLKNVISVDLFYFKLYYQKFKFI